MKKLSLLAALAASVLTLSACSDGGTAPAGADANNTNDSNTAEDAAPELPGIGEKAEGDGVAMTVDYVELTDDLEPFIQSDYTDPEAVLTPRSGATYVVVGATVENTGDSSMNPTCGGDLGENLYVGDRAYTAQSDQEFTVNYQGSCLVDLGPGLTETAKYIFEIPENEKPTKFGFYRYDGTVTMEEQRETRISLADYESKSERHSDGPNPSTTTEATQTTEAATTAAVTTTTATQQSAASSPAYGASCSAGQAGMPATGPDGSNLVCTGMGASGFSWVYGPAPRGAGTAELGGSCTEGEQGGQDAQGRLLLCSNGQWYSGP